MLWLLLPGVLFLFILVLLLLVLVLLLALLPFVLGLLFRLTLIFSMLFMLRVAKGSGSEKRPPRSGLYDQGGGNNLEAAGQRAENGPTTTGFATIIPGMLFLENKSAIWLSDAAENDRRDVVSRCARHLCEQALPFSAHSRETRGNQDYGGKFIQRLTYVNM